MQESFSAKVGRLKWIYCRGFWFNEHWQTMMKRRTCSCTLRTKLNAHLARQICSSNAGETKLRANDWNPPEYFVCEPESLYLLSQSMHKNQAAKHLCNIRLRVVEYAQILPHLTRLSTLPVSPRLPLCNSSSSSCNLSRLGEYQIQPTIDWIRWKLCQEVMSMLFQDSRCFNVLSHCVLLDFCTSIKPNRHR